MKLKFSSLIFFFLTFFFGFIFAKPAFATYSGSFHPYMYEHNGGQNSFYFNAFNFFIPVTHDCDPTQSYIVQGNTSTINDIGLPISYFDVSCTKTGGITTASPLPDGTYRIHYQELITGNLYISEAFTVVNGYIAGEEPHSFTVNFYRVQPPDILLQVSQGMDSPPIQCDSFPVFEIRDLSDNVITTELGCGSGGTIGLRDQLPDGTYIARYGNYSTGIFFYSNEFTVVDGVYPSAPTSIQLSGHITDNGITPISGVQIRTVNVGSYVTTDSDGYYSFAAPPENTNVLLVNNASNSGAAIVSSLSNNWTAQIPGLNLFDNTVYDIQIPTNTLAVHVEDLDGNPVANSFVQVFFPDGSATIPVTTSAGLVNGYFAYSENRSNTTFFGYTDNDGNLTGIVISGANYRIAADPPTGNTDYESASADKFISSNASQTIVLPFSNTYITPTPTLTNTPTPTPVPNVAPVVGAITAPVAPVVVNTQVNASANFTDGNPGDTHTAVFNWGDGFTSAGNITESNGSGSVAGSHVYLTTGVYTVTLIVTDNQNASDTSVFKYISVYNPTPQGLFSGGSHFQSPVGAYTANPSLTGQVKFGVTAKYQNGAATGNIRMDFKAGNLTFDSTAVTILVTAGGKATLQGTGTINGAGSYNILVTGIDSANTIRFKITDPSNNAVIYDSQIGADDTADSTTPVTGHITIH